MRLNKLISRIWLIVSPIIQIFKKFIQYPESYWLRVLVTLWLHSNLIQSNYLSLPTWYQMRHHQSPHHIKHPINICATCTRAQPQWSIHRKGFWWSGLQMFIVLEILITIADLSHVTKHIQFHYYTFNLFTVSIKFAMKLLVKERLSSPCSPVGFFKRKYQTCRERQPWQVW